MNATTTPRKRRKAAQADNVGKDANKVEVQQISLAEIELDDRNHRLEGSKYMEKVAELAASMKLNGQQQPVQVYEYSQGQFPPGGQRFLLAFGFRRCAAAKVNEWLTIAAIVKPMPLNQDGTIDRLKMDQIRSIENLQRENLNPVEECILIQKLMGSLPAQLDDSGTVSRDEDGTPSDAAIRHVAYGIGRTEAWVRDKLYLERLASSLKQSVLDGKLYLIFAREIAKLADHDEQERVASMCQADPRDGHCPTTIHQVRRYVADREQSLRGVPWQLDKTFPRHKLILGACHSCPFNSTNDKPLFEHDENAAPEGYCLRASCFEAKRAMAEKATKTAVVKIVKQGLPPTEATAAKITAEFVKPARVARQAKKEIEDVQPKKPKQKLEYHQTPEYLARVALGEAERNWRDQTERKFIASLRQTPGRLTALMLIGQTCRIRWGMTEKEVVKLHDLLKSTIKVSSSTLLQLEKKVLKRRGFELTSVVTLNGREVLFEYLAKLYGIELDAFPKLEQFIPHADAASDSFPDEQSPTD